MKKEAFLDNLFKDASIHKCKILLKKCFPKKIYIQQNNDNRDTPR